ncbi:hypothetical protein KP509_03G007000 [Ceratopteris richardii]|uniref:Uncharacterized protein n=1 Tax=Ceratopteris richardii TaxID=49495 RepID=A0A8T2V3L6_CERRI|nr:hypothetical protein KP509_03G007000 [Ceratopteris richardii]
MALLSAPAVGAPMVLLPVRVTTESCNMLLIFAIVLLFMYVPLFFLMIALLMALLLLRHGADPFFDEISPKDSGDTAAPAKSPYSTNLRIRGFSTVAPDQKKQAGGGRLLQGESELEGARKQSVDISGGNNGNGEQRQAPIDTLRNISRSHSVLRRPTNVEHEEAEELRRRSDAYIQRVRAEFRTQR